MKRRGGKVGRRGFAKNSAAPVDCHWQAGAEKIVVLMRAPLSAPERWLRSSALFLGRCLYRVTTHGAARLPEGGCLLLPNHLTWVDSIVLQIACPRPIRFIVYDEIYQLPLLK